VLYYKSVSDAPEKVTEELGISIEDLDLADTKDLLVKNADKKSIRFKGLAEPWRIRLNRMRTPAMRKAFAGLSKQVENGDLTEEQRLVRMCSVLVESWSNGPEPFSRQRLDYLLQRPGWSWLADWIMEQALEDANFMSGT
jgi:hypothetical protein